jgi:carbonic anhydrase/acetyltransferase-like protein (isoleucine patch superfamily)
VGSSTGLATIVEVNGVGPTIGADVWLAPTAVLIGDVRVGDRANIWFGTVLRADYSHIEIGAGCSVQDNAVLHCADGLPTVIGEGVEIAGGMLAAGVPAREKKQLSGSALRWTDTAVDRYQELRRQYLTTSREV